MFCQLARIDNALDVIVSATAAGALASYREESGCFVCFPASTRLICVQCDKSATVDSMKSAHSSVLAC